MEALRNSSLLALCLSHSVPQTQDEKLQDKIRQPIHKVIKRTRLKMVRCSNLAPTPRSRDPHMGLLLVVTRRDEELNWARGSKGSGTSPRRAAASASLVSCPRQVLRNLSLLKIFKSSNHRILELHNLAKKCWNSLLQVPTILRITSR